jgi:acetylornithine/N-succinyldiaminopimelate aminotransferase
LLVLDEIQTGIGRTGRWFATSARASCPDAITLAKGLAGGSADRRPGDLRPRGDRLLSPGQHGSTFGGNPLAARPLSPSSRRSRPTVCSPPPRRWVSTSPVGSLALGHPLVDHVRGSGLLRAIALTAPVSAIVADSARDAGFIVNPVAPDAIRIAPPLNLTIAEIDLFVDALPGLLDAAKESA